MMPFRVKRLTPHLTPRASHIGIHDVKAIGLSRYPGMTAHHQLAGTPRVSLRAVAAKGRLIALTRTWCAARRGAWLDICRSVHG